MTPGTTPHQRPPIPAHTVTPPPPPAQLIVHDAMVLRVVLSSIRPLFLFAASGELEGALTGGLWDSWFALLREALPKSKAITTGAKSDTAATAATATATATATASAGAGAGAGGGAGGGAGVAASAMPALDTGATLAEASDWAKRAYLRENSFVLVDKVRSAMEVPASVADKVVPLLEQRT